MDKKKNNDKIARLSYSVSSTCKLDFIHCKSQREFDVVKSLGALFHVPLLEKWHIHVQLYTVTINHTTTAKTVLISPVPTLYLKENNSDSSLHTCTLSCTLLMPCALK